MSLEEMKEMIKAMTEEAKKVAYCGGMSPEDYKIAKSAFPNGDLVAYPNHKETYDAVVSGECEVAILPFEKSYTGELGNVIDILFEGDLVINGVINLDTGSETIRYAVLCKELVELPEDSDGGFLFTFTVKDETGALAKAINTISAHGFNMSTMRSRKRKDLEWNYYFLAEANGDCCSAEGKKMFEELDAACESVKVLGHYA